MWPSCPSSTWTSRWCTRWTASWGGYRWSRQPRAGSTTTPTPSYWCGSTMITTMRGSWGTGGPAAFRRLAWPRCTTLDTMSLLGWIWRTVRRSVSEWFSYYLCHNACGIIWVRVQVCCPFIAPHQIPSLPPWPSLRRCPPINIAISMMWHITALSVDPGGELGWCST